MYYLASSFIFYRHPSPHLICSRDRGGDTAKQKIQELTTASPPGNQSSTKDSELQTDKMLRRLTDSMMVETGPGTIEFEWLPGRLRTAASARPIVSDIIDRRRQDYLAPILQLLSNRLLLVMISGRR